jgi:CubicO group peptidase (beta-lactamase class C family)
MRKMRMSFFLQKNLCCLIIAVPMIMNSGCKRRDSLWHEILTKQLNRDSPVSKPDTAFYHFMTSYHIPALSVTVAKDGKIFYSKTFGVADLSTGKEAANESLFRIAGISTVVTSLAIKKLVSLHQISYDSKVFGKEGILGERYSQKTSASPLADITVEDLLNHTSGGWWGNDDDVTVINFRAFFSSNDSALSWILNHTPLKDLPGKSFNFSYTGYFILGMVIEKVTGVTYEKWVKKNILEPCGITDMQVENESLQTPHEVSYYNDQDWLRYNNDIPENLHFSRAGPALGWISTSSDLVKLVLHFHGPDSLNTGIKSTGSLPILPGPRSKPDFAADWSSVDNSGNWWEEMDMTGSTGIVVRSSKGFCWAILINTYRPGTPDYFPDITKLINKTMDDMSVRL